MRPGAVDLSRQPWMRQILEDVLNPGVEHIHLVMGTQTGKTTTCMLAAALLHEFDPLPIFWALPSSSLADRHARARMFPFWQANPVLSAGVVNVKDQLRVSAMNTGPLTIYFVGAREPSALAHTAAAYVFADEEAKYEHVKKAEAHPSLLLEKRMGAFPRHLMVHASTPNEESNIFWQGYLQSDQNHFFVPCPHCGYMQRLEFSRDSVVWDHPDSGVTPEIVRTTARYICAACSQAIRDEDKPAMLAAGEWRAENDGAPTYRRGYRINTLYSTTVSFGECAEKFFIASRSNAAPAMLQDFRNNYEALPFVHYSIKVGDEQVSTLLGTYLRASAAARADSQHPSQRRDIFRLSLRVRLVVMPPLDLGVVVSHDVPHQLGRRSSVQQEGGGRGAQRVEGLVRHCVHFFALLRGAYLLRNPCIAAQFPEF